MSKCRLRKVREEANVLVFTEHTDRIHPQDLSDLLSAQVGKNKFKISLRKNIYVVYIIKEGSDGKYRDPDSEDEEISKTFSIGPISLNERLKDIKSAEEIMSRRRLPHH